ncbi:MAG TPA: chemotaxis protein CheB [Gemmatimonadaceae bacterium]|nr:chemotaxis protein CheB [Gemmatimonadaceae bacterium]
MPKRDIIVVAASAGGVEGLQCLASTLPAAFEGSVFVTLHFPEHGVSVLPRILARAGPLPAAHGGEGDHILPGRVYVAPPDHHMLLARSGIHLVRGPRENGSRPAADPMFRSAAVSFGPRVIGVVLTGNLDDGTAGLAAVKRLGGLAVVEDPETALFASMPRSALDHVAVDRVAPIGQIAGVLEELMNAPIPTNLSVRTDRDVMENRLAAGDPGAMTHAEQQHPGAVSAFSCPDCGGVLWEIHDGDFVRFRCRVGHAWTGAGLFGQKHRAFDDALWTALRALEESAALARQIAARQRARAAERVAERFEAQAAATEERAAVIRAVLEGELTEPMTAARGRSADADRPKRAS